jgi:twitching motility protein PilT
MVEIEVSGKSVQLTMERLCQLAVQHKASDLHLKSAMPPMLRIDGDIRATNIRPLADDEVRELAFSVMNERLRAAYEERGTIDFAYAMPSGDRFRVDVFRQRNMISVAARRVIRQIPTFDELHLPAETLDRLCDLHQGLIIFCGIAGCGKSTSIASCLERINQRRACHIITIEDPIEFLYEDKKAFISQREVGTDVESMEGALKFLMREDPDVVLVGEMRDRDTFEAAVQAAETGHLVFATLHASSPASAIGRILDLYPDEMQSAVRQNLAFNLAAIICQLLVPSCVKAFKRVPAVEILVVTGIVRKLIREAEDAKIEDVIKGRLDPGMIDFPASFVGLVEKGWITHETAYEYAPNPDAVRMGLKGIAVKQGIIR